MKNIIFYLLLCATSPIFSQINFESGYFIANNGTRTNGLIRNIDWKNNPVDFEYKITESDITNKASIESIKEFGIENGPAYFRFTVGLDRSPSDVNNLSQVKNPIFKKETIFLKLLVNGDANLYVYEDNNLVRYFISKKNQNIPEQLVYKEYMPNPGYAAENNMFRQQLAVFLKSDKLLPKDFEFLRYRKKDLIDLFLRFNGSNATSISAAEINTSGKFKLKALAGAGFNSLTIQYNNGSTKKYPFGGKTSYVLGFEAEYIFPFNKNKWSIFAGADYQQYLKQSTVNRTDLAINYKFIEIPFGFRHYLFLNDKSRFSVNAGYLLAVPFEKQLSVGKNAFEIAKSSDIFIGAGFHYKDFGIEARYVFTRAVINANILSDFRSTALVLSYNVL